MKEKEPETTTGKALKLIRKEWINDYKTKLRKDVNSLSTRTPMSEYDDGYNACLDDVLGLLLIED